MSINGIDPRLPNIPAIKPSEPRVAPQEQGKTTGGGFGEMFENALQEVNQLQTTADKQIEGLVLKSEGVTPHSAMIALEKADVAFQMMSAIRSKIVRAYEEIVRTQV